MATIPLSISWVESFWRVGGGAGAGHRIVIVRQVVNAIYELPDVINILRSRSLLYYILQGYVKGDVCMCMDLWCDLRGLIMGLRYIYIMYREDKVWHIALDLLDEDNRVLWYPVKCLMKRGIIQQISNVMNFFYYFFFIIKKLLKYLPCLYKGMSIKQQVSTLKKKKKIKEKYHRKVKMANKRHVDGKKKYKGQKSVPREKKNSSLSLCATLLTFFLYFFCIARSIEKRDH